MAEQITSPRRYLNQFRNRNVVESSSDMDKMVKSLTELNLSLSNISQSLSTQTTQLGKLQSTSRSLNSSKIFVNKEIPSGSIDGINTTYVLEHEPTPGSDHLYLNGLLIEDGTNTDYSILGSTITFDEPLLPGMKLHCTYYYSDPTLTKVLIDKEIPSGLINSKNSTYTLQHIPIDGSEHVYLNGLLQESNGNDYNISENIITFITPPETGLKIRVTYYHLI
jgi:hypothetical protein